MKVFISYARVDKPFCIQLVDTLQAHDIWYDDRLYAGQHWWKEILRRLDWCNIFIYLLSPDSVKSDYCRQEFDIACRLGRHIIPVLIDRETPLPEHLGELQYVDMTAGLNVENVTILLNSILKSEREQRDIQQTSAKKLQSVSENAKQPAFLASGNDIGMAAKAMQDGSYDEAILLLEQAKSNGYESQFIDIDALLHEAKIALEKQTRQREAKREYSQILALCQYERTRKIARKAFIAFHREYPDYDPEGLRRLFLKNSPNDNSHRAYSTKSNRRKTLPMLQWCRIPAGKVRIDSISRQMADTRPSVLPVSRFLMSKYPVTNQQFDYFIRAEDGYSNRHWWTYSDAAFHWYKTHEQPLESRFSGDERPRENISWYEAMAFCNWLSHYTGGSITLPTLAQWQYAAQGRDNRFFPWGNTYHPDICNTHESGLKMTTEVTRYDDGKSPFGVYDMAGNVWEWCLDTGEPDDEQSDEKRAVTGGSYVSPYDRAKITFHYFLNPESRFSSIGFRIVALS